MVPRRDRLKNREETVFVETVNSRDILPLGVVLIALSLVVVVGLFLRGRGVRNWLQIVEIGSSVVLSASLVFVYLSQNKILRKHRRMMSAGYSPVVTVRDVSLVERAGSKFPGSEQGLLQTLEVTATNRGNDIAANLELRCVLDDGEQESSGLLCRGSSNTTEPRTVSLHLEEESDGVYRDGGPALPPTMEESTTLYGHAGVNADGRYCTIPRAVKRAAERGADRVRLGFVLRYDDASGKTYSVLLRGFGIDDPGEGVSFDDLAKTGTELYRRDLDGRIDEELQSAE
ncbi:hypothetical protein [Halobaculum sp. MBLA0143]|uniref:hypothetical protein n=1 Tax=Halobaculum sp. MBLA0143 TaxID=3079933 RepID=UPI0035245334